MAKILKWHEATHYDSVVVMNGELGVHVARLVFCLDVLRTGRAYYK